MPTICLADTWAAEKAAAAPAVVASLTPANTVVDTWAVEEMNSAATVTPDPVADADGVGCLAAALPNKATWAVEM